MKRAFKTLNTSTFKKRKKKETDVKIFVTGDRKRTAIPVCVPRENFPRGPHPAGSPWHCQTGHVPPRQWLHHLLHQQCPTVTGYLPCWQEGLQEILCLQHWQGSQRNKDLDPSDIWCVIANRASFFLRYSLDISLTVLRSHDRDIDYYL